MRTKINKITQSDIGTSCTVKGWIRTVRDQGKFAFIAVNDGSRLSNLQVIAHADTLSDYEKIIPTLSTGAAVAVRGLIVESPGKGQAFELKAEEITVIGWNAESGDANPIVVAARIAEIDDCDLWGICEVQNSTWASALATQGDE